MPELARDEFALTMQRAACGLSTFSFEAFWVPAVPRCVVPTSRMACGFGCKPPHAAPQDSDLREQAHRVSLIDDTARARVQ